MIETESTLRYKLASFRPRKSWVRRWARRAAVAAVFVDRKPSGDDPGGVSLLFMKRATREGDPWSGDMSFPGGRTDPEDPNNFMTAVRELSEETGLDILAEGGEVISRLSDVQARGFRWGKRPFVVTPYLFWLDHEPENLQIEPSEVETLVWIPLEFFMDPKNRGDMVWQRGNLSIPLPCYDYGRFRVWGLTLRMIDELTAFLGRNERAGGTAVEDV